MGAARKRGQHAPLIQVQKGPPRGVAGHRLACPPDVGQTRNQALQSHDQLAYSCPPSQALRPRSAHTGQAGQPPDSEFQAVWSLR